MVWEWTSSTGMINIVSAAVAVNETVAQAASLIEPRSPSTWYAKSPSTAGRADIWGGAWPQLAHTTSAPTIHPPASKPASPSPSTLLRAFRASVRLVYLTRLRQVEFETEVPTFVRLALFLHSFHSDLDCTSIEFLLHGGVAGSSEPRPPRDANSCATDLLPTQTYHT